MRIQATNTEIKAAEEEGTRVFSGSFTDTCALQRAGKLSPAVLGLGKALGNEITCQLK